MGENNMKRSEIALLYAETPKSGECVTVCGWAKTVRDSKSIGFIVLSDGSSFKSLQIVFEAEKEEQDIMNRLPRSADERLFTPKTLFLSLMQGFVVLGVVLLVYLHSLMSGLGETEVRTMTFITIVLANLLLILTNRSWSETIISTIRTPNKAMGWVFAGTICSLVLILTVPALRDLFRFSLISAEGIVTCVLAAGVSVLWFEAWKLWNVRKDQTSHILSEI